MMLSNSTMVINLAAKPKQIFLLDGIGAIITSVSLGLLMPQINSYVGMPVSVLSLLAVLGCVFAVYSLCCSVLLKHPPKPYLAIIMVANLAYCGLTLSLIYRYFELLTGLGVAYFLFEIGIIILLVYIELSVYKHME